MTWQKKTLATVSILTAMLALVFSACGGSSGSGKAAAPSGGNSAGSGGGHGPSCNLMSAAEVGAALGVSGLQSPTSTVNDIVTLCQYAAGGNPNQVLIRYQTPTTPSDFMIGKDGFAQNGFSTMDVTGLGDAAYSSTLGSGSLQVNSLVVLGKSTEFEISAPASLDQIETLARAILAKL